MSDPYNGLSGAVDVLSPLAHRLLKLNAATAYAQPVVHGKGNEEARAALEMIQPDQLLSVPVRSHEAADAMLAGLWLWHDWLDESHKLSQDLHDASGSFWHAIMHRREGDFSNSKYWYHRVGSHPVLPAIGQNVALMVNQLPADKALLKLLRNGWDPDALVDFAQEIDRHPNDPRLPAFVGIQQTEWRMLFDHCTRKAAGQ